MDDDGDDELEAPELDPKLGDNGEEPAGDEEELDPELGDRGDNPADGDDEEVSGTLELDPKPDDNGEDPAAEDGPGDNGAEPADDEDEPLELEPEVLVPLDRPESGLDEPDDGDEDSGEPLEGAPARGEAVEFDPEAPSAGPSEELLLGVGKPFDDSPPDRWSVGY